MRPARFRRQALTRQHGVTLLIMLVIVAIGITTALVSSLGTTVLKTARQEKTTAALAQAKDALIGYSGSQTSIAGAGYLLVPDTGWAATPEGNSEGTLGARDISVIGRVPWKTIGISPLRDGQGECLWYVVSGRFKNSPKTNDYFNWDTQGQIDVIDANGHPITNNVTALIVAPGSVLDSQSRTLADPALAQCGGNYNARNYLDSYDSADSSVGEVNYFSGSTNNMLAPNTSNKRFVMANNDHYNDRFLFVTVDDIFRPIIQRNDFKNQISALLDDIVFIAYLKTFTITGTKGTGNIDGTGSVDCANTSNTANQTFCKNWKEMLLLTELPAPSSITIDSAPTTICTRVLIFGGQKTAAQVRLTATDKSNPAMYLEGANLAAFATPIAASSNFSGASTFNANYPSVDLLRCLP